MISQRRRVGGCCARIPRRDSILFVNYARKTLSMNAFISRLAVAVDVAINVAIDAHVELTSRRLIVVG